MFFWLVTLLVIGGLVAYAPDGSGQHGERTLALTLLFGGVTLCMVGFADWTSFSWWRQRNVRSDHVGVPQVVSDGQSSVAD